MTDKLTDCDHDGCKGGGAICGGIGQMYVARWKPKGTRKWTVLGKPTKTQYTALNRVIKAAGKYDYERGDVLLIADYYDPIQVFEVVKRA